MIPDPAQEKRNQDVDSDKLLPLLEERSRLKEVLRLIESKGKEVSAEVFLRVRSDYQARLDGLNREINRQARNFETTLKDYRELVEHLERAVDLGVKSLEELKVRYALGEYLEEEFETIAREKKAKIDFYRGKIKNYRANMDRLENVLTHLETS